MSPLLAPRRAIIVDTLALITFFTVTGIFNEHFIARMNWGQVFHARVLGAVLMIPVGRPLRPLARLAHATRPAEPHFATTL